MSKVAATFTGLAASAAILYHFRHELTSDMREVRSQLHNVQNRLAGSIPGTKISNAMTSHPTSSILEKPKELLDESTQYVSKRLVPSVKDNWNSHIIGLANSVNELDAEKVQKLAKEAKDKWL